MWVGFSLTYPWEDNDDTEFGVENDDYMEELI